MNWNSGFTANYYLTVVDPASWRDLETIDITGGTINKTTESLMESGSVDLTENVGEKWVRLYLDARQDDGGGRTALFTGLVQCPENQWNGNMQSCSGELYSVLKAVDDVLLPRGWYALRGQNGAQLAANLLSMGVAPVEYENNSPELSNNIIAEDGETALTMARRLVDAIGWRIRINGHGDIKVCPKKSDPVIRLDPQLNDIVEPSITDKKDLFSCPNVFRATSGDLSAEARDEEAIQARGREVQAGKNNVTLNTGESIQQYADRMLAELQAPARTVKYTRQYQPDIVPGDVVELNFPAQKISGLFQIAKQKISIGYGAPVDEEVTGIVTREAETGIKQYGIITDLSELFETSDNEIIIGVKNV